MKGVKKVSFIHKNKPESGFTIIEVLIALAIFSVGILSLVYLHGLAVSNISHSRKFTEAAALAQGRAELLLTLPFERITNEQEEAENAYTIETGILNSFDIDSDGKDDMITVRIIVIDPSGVERSSLDILKARSE